MSAESALALEVKGLQKTFLVGLSRRPFPAAQDINLEVQHGEIFGFLGPNGAGKTTTIKTLLGLVRATAGTVRILGLRPDDAGWRSQVGYMPEHPNFYDFLTGLEMVAWFGRLAGLGRHEAHQAARRLLDRVGLSHAMDRRLRSYSKGMLQRAGLAQSLIGAPKLLILDEPMTGLDPIGRREIRDLILELRSEGRTIFYSTHILPDVEMTCDRVAIVHRGKTVRSGRLSDILVSTTQGVAVTVDPGSAELARVLTQEHPSAVLRDGAIEVIFTEIQAARAFLTAAEARGASLLRFEPHRDDLEAIFMRSLGTLPVEGEGTGVG
ncbi:MAG: ABC transporter ATP-binding protein [Deltaproteobacteria bacterium]|nr:ABC transporter ATP-binding protein [Deltaproteobacteria bacterium]